MGSPKPDFTARDIRARTHALDAQDTPFVDTRNVRIVHSNYPSTQHPFFGFGWARGVRKSSADVLAYENLVIAPIRAPVLFLFFSFFGSVSFYVDTLVLFLFFQHMICEVRKDFY